MLDATIRPILDQVLYYPARFIARRGVKANHITLAGGVLGAGAFVAVALGYYQTGLCFILANRLADGLDGAVARSTGATDLGGYLDIVIDFLFYASIPLGFAVAQPDHALASAFLIFTFIGTASSFLAFAVVAAKRGLESESRGRKSFYFLGGLTEGVETLGFLVIICLLPTWFAWLAVIFGLMCLITTATRILMAYDAFNETLEG